jgi:hypothetical protein
VADLPVYVRAICRYLCGRSAEADLASVPPGTLARPQQWGQMRMADENCIALFGRAGRQDEVAAYSIRLGGSRFESAATSAHGAICSGCPR